MQSVKIREPQMRDDAVEDIQLMTANLLKIKRQITERDQEKEKNIFQKLNQSIREENINLEQTKNNRIIKDKIRQQYDKYLSTVQMPNNHQDKLFTLLNQPLQIGTIVALFQMIFYFREALNQQILQEVSQKAFSKLKKSKSSQIEITCILQLLAICGVYNQQCVNYVIQSMLQQQINFQQCFIFLSNMGYPGLSTLVHLARQDFKSIPHQILDYLSRTQEIIQQVLVPTLVNDLQTAKNKQKYVILSILNRLNGLVGKNSQLYRILIEILQNNSVQRGFIASVLRSAGMEGQKILLQFINQFSNNQKIMIPAISVLPWRVQSNPVLRIKVIEYSLGSNFLPGTLYQYEGKIQPSVFCYEEEDCCDSLCLNARDFIAALQRLLSIKIQNCENQQTLRTTNPNNIKLFSLYQIIKSSQNQQIQISSQCIKVLTKCLNNENPQIREAALNSLGQIGLPQAFQSIQHISKCLWDVNSKPRSMACWAISKLCQQPNKIILHRLVQLLKDNYWKVRVSACICLGNVVTQPYQFIIQGLMRCLKDNSVNKLTVCESIIRLGQIGQELLLQILKTTNPNDFKLKQAIICCLRQADIKSTNIDYVIEEIFKNCKGIRVQTRQLCLQTLNSLRLRALQQQQQIIYLKAKSILPFYYYFLQDPIPKIRQLAAEFILSFGGQAQLIFIEGMTKGSSLVRIESAKGLGKLGVQNFRALILGLRDQDAKVKKITTQVILRNFSSSEISEYYLKKPNQTAALLCNLKDILGNGIENPIKKLIKEVISSIQKKSKGSITFDQNFMRN